MRTKAVLQSILLSAGVSMACLSAQTVEFDTLATSAGDLTITFVGHGDTDHARLTALLADEPGIEVRVRRMKQP